MTGDDRLHDPLPIGASERQILRHELKAALARAEKAEEQLHHMKVEFQDEDGITILRQERNAAVTGAEKAEAERDALQHRLDRAMKVVEAARRVEYCWGQIEESLGPPQVSWAKQHYAAQNELSDALAALDAGEEESAKAERPRIHDQCARGEEGEAGDDGDNRHPLTPAHDAAGS